MLSPESDSIVISKDVVPIFVGTSSNPCELISHEGTGFMIAPNILVSCAHCVREELPADRVYVIVFYENEKPVFRVLRNITVDPSGNDLATANVDHEPSIPWKFPVRDLLYGEDVFSFGYPLLDRRRLETGTVQFDIQGRYLQGYVTRPFHFQHPGGRTIHSYELDMPAPAGLSGAPLIALKSHTITGVIYGTNDVTMIEDASIVDLETGMRMREVQRIISFGLAHHTSSLKNLAGLATEGRTLSELLPT